MTSEDIKAMYSMCDIVTRYGLHINRNGFCHCPFHTGDRTPSLKIYERDYYCYACGANGDIFTFVQNMDNLTFKEVFKLLGGLYEEQSFSSKYKIDQAKRKRAKQKLEVDALKADIVHCNLLIGVYRKQLGIFQPLSDEWCTTYNALQYQIYMSDYLNEKR